MFDDFYTNQVVKLTKKINIFEFERMLQKSFPSYKIKENNFLNNSIKTKQYELGMEIGDLDVIYFKGLVVNLISENNYSFLEKLTENTNLTYNDFKELRG